MATDIQKPIPQVDDESRPYFEAAKRGELMIMRCKACGEANVPGAQSCYRCASFDLDWTKASGRGTLHTFGLMHQMYHPAWANEMPYNIAVVQLEEGPRITTNVVGCANEDLRVGMAVEVTFDPVSDDVSLVRFRPA